MSRGAEAVHDVLDLVLRTQGGLTTKEVVARLPRRNPGTVSSVLSKLALYGVIEREWHRTNGGQHRRWCTWKRKPEYEEGDDE